MGDLLRVLVIGIILLATCAICWAAIAYFGIVVPHIVTFILSVLLIALFVIWALKLLFKQAQ